MWRWWGCVLCIDFSGDDEDVCSGFPQFQREARGNCTGDDSDEVSSLLSFASWSDIFVGVLISEYGGFLDIVSVVREARPPCFVTIGEDLGGGFGVVNIVFGMYFRRGNVYTFAGNFFFVAG